VSRRRWAPRRRLGLRNRVALGFALMALLLSSVVAVGSWVLVSRYLDHQREASAVAGTVDNALLLRARIAEGQQATTTLVDSLEYPPGTAALLVYGGRSYGNHDAGMMRLPPDLLSNVRHGATESRRLSLDGESYLVVGASLGRTGNALFELYPLADLQRTFRRLWLILAAAAVVTALVGLVVGRMASRRMLRPLAEVTEAAASIAHGDLSARLSTGRDPDLADLADSFNRTAAELEQRVRADARFAGDVSHELRTPLTTMLNSLALLVNRRAGLPAELTEPLDLLQEDMYRFRRLVVDLLDISRADGGYEGARERVEVGDLVRRAADAAAGRPVTVVEPGARGVAMYADKRRLERVLTNLVENAETHGGGCREVRVCAEDHIVRVVVDDLGPGVPPDRRDRIFDRFARDGTSPGTGVGLGLAIVARHVHWHGGEVRVGEAPGGGARFVVDLPLGP
jgi:two-component system, OmpR family, sensor histidine kinase MtrB